MSDPRAAWWHERDQGLGLVTALDARRVRHVRTPGHEIEVLTHDRLGWALALDRVLRHVEEDQGPREMLVHVPLLGRAGEPRVLVVGGGDGAVLREVLQHPVARVDVIEPESALPRLAHLLDCAGALRDARVTLHASLPPGSWDVILLDRALLPLAELAPRLLPGGVIVEWDVAVLGLRPRWLRRGDHPERLTHEERYFAGSPLRPGGFLGFSLHTREAVSHAEPRRDFEGLHYNPELHRAAFALPPFWSELP
jgi:spermidine synthase